MIVESSQSGYYWFSLLEHRDDILTGRCNILPGIHEGGESHTSALDSGLSDIVHILSIPCIYTTDLIIADILLCTLYYVDTCTMYTTVSKLCSGPLPAAAL